ncbi:hypothetical protein BHM03_00053948 [Ensete ventricosum]|nr:hypothetical protein BHM03_00053948 [Ensete ventricosum]
MLRPGVTQEWVDEGGLPRERTKNRRWQRSYEVLAEATHGEVIVVKRGEEATTSSMGLNYPKAKCRLERRWTQRSATISQRRIYRSRRKGHSCKVMDSKAMGLAAPWYRRGGTSVESSIPCSHVGRALVVKGAKEVENTEANSKY